MSKRGNNVRLSVTTYFQVLRNGGGEEVKPDVIGRSKNTRVPPDSRGVPFEMGEVVSEMAWTADISIGSGKKNRRRSGWAGGGAEGTVQLSSNGLSG